MGTWSKRVDLVSRNGQRSRQQRIVAPCSPGKVSLLVHLGTALFSSEQPRLSAIVYALLISGEFLLETRPAVNIVVCGTASIDESRSASGETATRT